MSTIFHDGDDDVSLPGLWAQYPFLRVIQIVSVSLKLRRHMLRIDCQTSDSGCIMVKIESAPAPTCNSTRSSCRRLHQLSIFNYLIHLRNKTLCFSSNDSLVSAVGVSVGIRTRRIVGSTYLPPTFCMDHAWNQQH